MTPQTQGATLEAPQTGHNPDLDKVAGLCASIAAHPSTIDTDQSIPTNVLEAAVAAADPSRANPTVSDLILVAVDFWLGGSVPDDNEFAVSDGIDLVLSAVNWNTIKSGSHHGTNWWTIQSKVDPLLTLTVASSDDQIGVAARIVGI